MTQELKEFELGKFKFNEAPWGDVNMSWVEDAQHYDFSDNECDMDINKDEAEKLITFLAGALNISLNDLAHRNQS